jgi:UDP-glucuronate 4-epimerase
VGRTILVTGAAGFIGSHVAERLLGRGDVVVGLDNFNDYYDPARKRANALALARGAGGRGAWHLVEGDVRDRDAVARLFARWPFDAVVHLAAMAGVRASIDNPQLYLDVNLGGTLALLDAAVGRTTPARAGEKPTFVFASTSSVYGATARIPFVEDDPCGRPVAPYAASKRAGELLGYTYHHLYGLPFTALRFFTVYGPRGRPDMMAYKVLDNIFFGRQVPLYNGGRMQRDWTYVEDIVGGVVAAADRPLGYEVLNLGRGQPVLLADFVRLLEECTGRRAALVPGPMPDADVPVTYADVGKARRLLGYDPQVSVGDGVARFWRWYREAVLQETGAGGARQGRDGHTADAPEVGSPVSSGRFPQSPGAP